MNSRVGVVGLAIFGASCVRQPAVTRVSTPPPQTAWERQIQNARDAGDGDYQLRALRDKVATEPANVVARLELAKAYRERGYPDVALEICRLAVARFPESAEAQLGLAEALHAAGRRKEALEGIEAFLNTHPQTAAEYYSWVGILHDEAGEWPQGEPAHRKALELNSRLDYLHNNLGYNLLMQKKYAEAAAELREALKRNPGSQVARNNLGLALANEDAGAEAVAVWQAGMDPATAHNNLAAVLMEKGNYTAARKELQIALDYNKSFPAALKNLELISRADGLPVAFKVRPEQTWWDRWWTGFKKLWVGPLDDSRKETVKTTASRPANGEER